MNRFKRLTVLLLAILILLSISCSKDSTTGPDNKVLYTLTIRVNNSEWGNTTPTVGTYSCEEDIIVTIIETPSEGYRFASWTGEVADSTSATTTVTMDGDKTVTANFAEISVLPDIIMVSIPGGTFQMGDEDGDLSSECRPVHTVTVSSFEINIYEVTNAQYAEYLNEALASGNIEEIQSGDVYGKTGAWSGQRLLDIGLEYNSDNKCWIQYDSGVFTVTTGKENWPVVAVTWYGAKSFAQHYGLDLPTEAEWEYASRGDNQYKYGTDDGMLDSSKANYNRKVGHPVNVGSYPANPFGLYDMSGNVFEWCNDWWDSYTSGSVINPIGLATGYGRVLRGGSWYDGGGNSRSAIRFADDPSAGGDDLGFRVVRRQ